MSMLLAIWFFAPRVFVTLSMTWLLKLEVFARNIFCVPVLSVMDLKKEELSLSLPCISFLQTFGAKVARKRPKTSKPRATLSAKILKRFPASCLTVSGQSELQLQGSGLTVLARVLAQVRVSVEILSDDRAGGI